MVADCFALMALVIEAVSVAAVPDALAGIDVTVGRLDRHVAAAFSENATLCR